jgi:hypothetical protein
MPQTKKIERPVVRVIFPLTYAHLAWLTLGMASRKLGWTHFSHCFRNLSESLHHLGMDLD